MPCWTSCWDFRTGPELGICKSRSTRLKILLHEMIWWQLSQVGFPMNHCSSSSLRHIYTPTQAFHLFPLQFERTIWSGNTFAELLHQASPWVSYAHLPSCWCLTKNRPKRLFFLISFSPRILKTVMTSHRWILSSTTHVARTPQLRLQPFLPWFQRSIQLPPARFCKLRPYL